jgi:hypothetical protein
MHRIDGAGHVDHMFVGEDVATSRPPTEFTPEWFNAVQEEVAGVVEAAGIALVKGDNTQLQKAIAKMIQAGQRSVIINNAVFAGAVTGTGKAVYWDSANSRFDLALADGSAKQNCVGFADVANANVYAFGDAVLFAGLTPGARYYLDGTTAGSITVTAPANVVFLGIARTATEMFVDVDSLATVTATNDTSFADNSVKPASTSWVRGAMAAIATAAGFVISAGVNGYVKAPSWLGGLIFQWGTLFAIPYNQAAGAVLTFPITFPTDVWHFGSTGFAVTGVANFANINPMTITTSGVSNYSASSNAGSGTFNVRWFAFGR